MGCLRGYTQTLADAIGFINGHMNKAVSPFFPYSEGSSYSEVTKDGTVKVYVKLIKDPSQDRIESCNMKWLNPENLKTVWHSKTCFYLDLYTYNGLKKAIDHKPNIGRSIPGNHIIVGPFNPENEEDLEKRLKKAFSFAIRKLGGKEDSF